MNKEQLMGRLLTATPSELKKIAQVFTGEGATEPTDRRLYNIQQAARELNISRTSVWRLLKSGRLPFVELRKGSRRIPSEAITAFVKGGVK
ncbi:MAG: Helix-turn-helix domain protein [Firmicutes bacterium ADurb.Bin262]|nr:MAG: Helix-turn-helix domain protein [Firmicutes bacterium ADurb.Bin262]OQA62741.1 MAG: Helix-turn-helix domain protein [Firmicutes bacterium ADurb.Bin262]OQA62838.1 MAG: Helix-turn-helix domain protein [Firmicutes bacterium ADurb.Bin262]